LALPLAGVFIISDGAGNNAAETRWWCDPVFDAGGSALMRWKLIKNINRVEGALE